MIIREITKSDKKIFNQAVTHPLQSFEWGEFRKQTGVKVVRKGVFEGEKLKTAIQVTIHPIPKLKYRVGYFPKGTVPDKEQIKALKEIGEENNCLMIKMEPNVSRKINKDESKSKSFEAVDKFLINSGCQKGRPLFTKHTFQLDLTKSEEELMSLMEGKTRYNVRLAQKKGVEVVLDNSDNSFKWFLNLLFEKTVKRQGFYAHTPKYFEKMWQILNPSGITKLLRASYNGQTLAVFMVFVFGETIYYPYGASTRKNKELMSPNLLMWELIKYGKRVGCSQLDMWGSLGPRPNRNDDWFGFHRFKQGYGGDLVEFLGSYDLVLNPRMYAVYKIADKARWLGLRTQARIKKMPYEAKRQSKKMVESVVSLFE
jgi:lipid II:glycine glycyltransferase (peptidoglycan interpeptide bridge formation enzyme)